MNLALPPDLSRVLSETPALARAYLVGGCVRDALLGRAVKDFDVEVFGVRYEALAEALSKWGKVDRVGKSFGVVKLSLPGGAIHDFSVPRRDSKIGPGHRGFESEFDPQIAPREAAARRDFTINALMWDPRTGALLDFFGGQRDLEARVLRHTGPAFTDDPLRVLRGMQFAGRFALTATPATIELCQQIRQAYQELARERVREEWFKWAIRSVKPSAGLQFIEASGWIEHFPEVAAMQGVPQQPDWHPEGDVFVHTCHCLDALVSLPSWQAADEDRRAVWSFAVLAHDFGKAVVTREEERHGRPCLVSPAHEIESERLALTFLERIHAPADVRARVAPLVRQHMAHLQELTERAVRRLARRLAPETIESLCVVMTADAMGRPPRPPAVPAVVPRLLAKAAELRVRDAAPKPVLLGRHLLALGLPVGREIGRIVAAAFEAQLDGAFHDLPGAHRWLAMQELLPEAVRHRALATASAAQVVVALGSNLDDSAGRVEEAVERLRALAGAHFRASSLWRSTPVDCPPGSPEFVNAVVVFAPRPGHTPESLLNQLQSMECESGRRRGEGINEPRPLDLDLIAFGDQTRATPRLTLPHARAHRRRFVLEPLAEVAPDLILPGHAQTVAELLSALRTDEVVVRLQSLPTTNGRE